MLARSLLTLSLAAGLSACVSGKAPIAFSPSDACSVSASTYDSREVQCHFPKTEFGRKFRLKANFSGGHDDTVARLEPSLDDSPLNCDAGSKTHLSAEDGDVSLWCVFSPSNQNSSNQNKDGGIFKATIRWSHAEYVNYEIAAQ